MTAAKPGFWWAAKARAAATFCLAGSLVGTGLYFGNLSYVTMSDDAARAAVAAQRAGTKAEAAAQRARIVTLSPAAATSPKALQVLDLLSKYFNAINTRNYAEYSSTLSSPVQVSNAQSAFDSGYATTTDTHEVITNITTNYDNALTATVSFTATQNPADSVDDSPCNKWTLSFPLVPQGTGYVIGPQPSGYQPTYSNC
jgi:hypothetical protein